MTFVFNGPSKRERAERLFADLLTRRWQLLSEAERRLAVQTAFEYGEAFAEQYSDAPDARAYLDVCVWWAFDSVRVINAVEFARWEARCRGSEPAAVRDPRVLSFVLGCEAWRAEHGE